MKLISTYPGAQSYIFINFCNILGILIEHHLSISRPYLLFLTETLVLDCFDSKPYCPYPQFLAKCGGCAYVRHNVVCYSVSNLESSEFTTLWLKLSCNSPTKFTCSLYLSPNYKENENATIIATPK
ncbi:UNVERIFIED_CONTAM: hypothetical protein RMT77_003006 [Armadillidium vulgare]